MKVPGKVFKTGNSYGVRLSKHWIESGIVKEGEEIEVELPIEKTKNGTSGICTFLDNPLFTGISGIA